MFLQSLQKNSLSHPLLYYFSYLSGKERRFNLKMSFSLFDRRDYIIQDIILNLFQSVMLFVKVSVGRCVGSPE